MREMAEYEPSACSSATPMTQNHTRDTATMNEDDDASLKDTANGNSAMKSQKDSHEENVRLTKRTFNDSEKDNDSEFDDIECHPSKKTKASAVSTFCSTSQPATSGVIPGWSSIVEASVPNHNKKSAFPYGKIASLAQHSQFMHIRQEHPFSGLGDHPDLPDVPPDVEITKAQKPIISMEQKSSSQRAPTCGVSPRGSVGEAQRQTSTDYIPEWPATSSSVLKEQEDQVWPDPSPSGADRTSSQSLSEIKTQGTTRRIVPLSLFCFAVPLDSSDNDAPSSTQFMNRVNSDSKFRSDVDMDAPTSAQPSKRSKVNPEPSSNHDMDHNIEGPNNINDNSSDIDDNASDQSDTLVKENRDVRMDDGEDCDLRRKDRNSRKVMEHKIQLKPNSSRQCSLQSLKRYAFKTRIQISQEKLSANSTQSKGMMALAIAKTSSTANVKSKQKSLMQRGLATCEADDDATDHDNDTDFDGSGSTAHVQGKVHCCHLHTLQKKNDPVSSNACTTGAAYLQHMALNKKKLQEDYKSDASVYIVGAGGLKKFCEVLDPSPWPSLVDPPLAIGGPFFLALFRTFFLGLLWWALLWPLVDPPP
ncbi:hypothetical protein C8R48DRAFT_668913 [Suillus tomentosus]|nr:hypothetical protein C8R48DRAFT_668913 [Suillus tomentosus]